jgi:hypothetical protein
LAISSKKTEISVMGKKIRLKLDDLKVESFVTSSVKGGLPPPGETGDICEPQGCSYDYGQNLGTCPDTGGTAQQTYPCCNTNVLTNPCCIGPTIDGGQMCSWGMYC